jgi:hypothetical protein
MKCKFLFNQSLCLKLREKLLKALKNDVLAQYENQDNCWSDGFGAYWVYHPHYCEDSTE